MSPWIAIALNLDDNEIIQMKINEKFLFSTILCFQQKQPQSCQFSITNEKPSF